MAEGQSNGPGPNKRRRTPVAGDFLVRKDGADGKGSIDGVSSDKHFFSRLRLAESKATAPSTAARQLSEQPCLRNVGH